MATQGLRLAAREPFAPASWRAASVLSRK